MKNPSSVLLIVEDDAWTRAALARLMERVGWTILIASTVTEGLELLGELPGCVILNLDLPDGRGEIVLRTIREEGISSRVVVCTAGTDEDRLRGVGKLAPYTILHKPGLR